MVSRKLQPVSFNLDNVYEAQLRKFALEQDKYFSQYVKRLIDKDRASQLTTPAASVDSRESIPNIPSPTKDNKPVEFKKANAAKFLL